MGEAAAWGFVAASALVIAAEVAFRVPLGRMLVGLIMAFGVGTLTSSIAFELVAPAFELVGDVWLVAAGLLLGAVTFVVGDRLVVGLGSRRRRHRLGDDGAGSGSGLGIALGAALDGVPETAVLGMSLVTVGAVNPALLVAIWISNFPESLSATADMVASGRTRRQVRALWWGIAAASAVAAAIGYAFVKGSDEGAAAGLQAFAAGALLTMIADEMAPEAFGRSALYAGLATTGGFVVGFLLTTLA
jgi:ZIP family zinc transporter